jgi:hypothetical protein
LDDARSDGLRNAVKNMPIGDIRPREEDDEEDGPSTSIWVNPSTSTSDDQDQPIKQEIHDDNSQVQDQPDSSTSPSTSSQEPVVQPRIHHASEKITRWIKSWVALVRVFKLDLTLLYFVNIILLYLLLSLTV